MAETKSSDAPTSDRTPTVVGIGASAGGVEALQRFFATVPPDLGLAYVVIVHLSPRHESDLAEIIGRRTPMQVREVVDGEELPLEPDHVYVISPDRQLEMSDTAVSARPFDQPHGQRTAIDTFFSSLAASHGTGFAVVLSGGGSDGVIGARAVKEAGGLVLVQDPGEAAHDAMPRAVIDADIADVVEPVAGLAKRLAKLARQRAKLPPFIHPVTAEPTVDAHTEASLKPIFEMIRARTGHDFSRYKRATILRRLGRRMQLAGSESVERYAAFLGENPEEVRNLFDDLLISVTSFFRDPEAWELLASLVVRPLVAQVDPNEPIRVWVPACATGEEAYSLTMLFREEIARTDKHRDLVVFASDVDQAALAVAREGLYPAAIVADLPEHRLVRWFRSEGDHYRVASEIRDTVVFAAHNVLRDPPFSKLHLISCRNLLIYLDRDLQRQLQNVFRYALRDDGYLFVGISETVDPSLFEHLDKQHRLFRVHAQAQGRPVRLPQMPVTVAAPPAEDRMRERFGRPGATAAEVHLEALERHAPPSALIDSRGKIQHLSESVGRYLQPRGGPPTNVLADLVRPELADELRRVLRQVFEVREPVRSNFRPVHFNGTPRLVGLLVQPRPDPDGQITHALVLFLEADEAEDGAAPQESSDHVDANVDRLREQLRHSEHRLETMRVEHGEAYEDLRAANEELQSLNEEYRSTTEELETSKEELQSVNEELQTVNHELKLKLEEVSRANNDLENFMAATEIPMLFLDRGLSIKRYTAPLAEIFSVKPSDLGRPISDLTHQLEYEGLGEEAARVLEDLTPREFPVRTRQGQELEVRIRPYRTIEHKIEGVVITFVR